LSGKETKQIRPASSAWKILKAKTDVGERRKKALTYYYEIHKKGDWGRQWGHREKNQERGFTCTQGRLVRGPIWDVQKRD